MIKGTFSNFFPHLFSMLYIHILYSFHHTFPFDYATGELGGKLNLTKKFIDAMAYLGLAYDLKRASDSSIESRREKTKLYKGGS